MSRKSASSCIDCYERIRNLAAQKIKSSIDQLGHVQRNWLKRIRALVSSKVMALVPFSLNIPSAHLHHKCVFAVSLNGHHPSTGGQYSWDFRPGRDTHSLETQS